MFKLNCDISTLTDSNNKPLLDIKNSKYKILEVLCEDCQETMKVSNIDIIVGYAFIDYKCPKCNHTTSIKLEVNDIKEAKTEDGTVECEI